MAPERRHSRVLSALKPAAGGVFFYFCGHTCMWPVMLLERHFFFLFSHVRGSFSSSSLRQSLRRTRLRDYSFSSHTWGARDGTAFCDSATIAYQSASPGRLAIRPGLVGVFDADSISRVSPRSKSRSWSKGRHGGVAWTRNRPRRPAFARPIQLAAEAPAPALSSAESTVRRNRYKKSA